MDGEVTARAAHVWCVDQLPFYASGALAEDERRAVAAHLAVCAACRDDLAFWREAGDVVADSAAALPAPSAAPLIGALREIRRTTAPRDRPVGVWISPSSRTGRAGARWRAVGESLAFAGQMLRAQAPLVHRELWSASALVMALGLVVALLMPAREQAAGAIGAIAPLLAAAGLALIYGAEHDPALELTLATPTSPRQVLLARLALVFGYDFALAIAATVALAAIVPPSLLGGVALGWLGPMAFLSALALVISLRCGAGVATAAAFTIWLARWLARGVFEVPSVTTSDTLTAIARAYAAAWTNTPALLAAALLLGALAVWMVGRGEPARAPAA